MPKYKWNIENILFEEDVKGMYDKAKNKHEAALVSLLWITAARPGEIKKLTTEDIRYSSDKLSLLLQTLKKGRGKDFKVRERTLDFVRPSGLNTNIYIETIINYISGLPVDRETLVLKFTTRWMEKVVTRLGMETLKQYVSPYHFRHSTMTWLAKAGYTPDMLKYFKGAESLASVDPYIHAIPQVVNLENIRRSRKAFPQSKPLPVNTYTIITPPTAAMQGEAPVPSGEAPVPPLPITMMPPPATSMQGEAAPSAPTTAPRAPIIAPPNAQNEPTTTPTPAPISITPPPAHEEKKDEPPGESETEDETEPYESIIPIKKTEQKKEAGV